MLLTPLPPPPPPLASLSSLPPPSSPMPLLYDGDDDCCGNDASRNTADDADSDAANYQQTPHRASNIVGVGADDNTATTANGANDDGWETRELDAEILQRFVRLSCDKMLASRQARGGARLYKNLLILQLLRRVRNDTKMYGWQLSFRKKC